jgi:hypothetical protein
MPVSAKFYFDAHAARTALADSAKRVDPPETKADAMNARNARAKKCVSDKLFTTPINCASVHRPVLQQNMVWPVTFSSDRRLMV